MSLFEEASFRLMYLLVEMMWVDVSFRLENPHHFDADFFDVGYTYSPLNGPNSSTGHAKP